MIKVNNFFLPNCIVDNVTLDEKINVNCDIKFKVYKRIFKDIEKLKAICNFIEYEKINEVLNSYAIKKRFKNWEELEEEIEKECNELFKKNITNIEFLPFC